MQTYDKLADGWLMLGKLYSLTNKQDSAIYSLNKCLTIDPTNQEALQIKKDLEK
jgi:cytochrome c-type biogenesis protein CcmH/NrfG